MATKKKSTSKPKMATSSSKSKVPPVGKGKGKINAGLAAYLNKKNKK